MTLKKFFRRRTVRVIMAAVFILCTLFTFVIPSFATVSLPQVPSVIYKPPQMDTYYTYEYGLPLSAGSQQDVFTVFWLQNYFGGFNMHHPVAIICLASGDSYLTYLLCTSNAFDGLSFDTNYFNYRLTFESGSGTVFYYLLTDQGFIYDHVTDFSVSSITLGQFDVMWYVDYNTSSAELGTILEDWKHGNFQGGSNSFEDRHPLLELDSAVNKWIKYYVTATTLADRQEIYDEAYDLAYEVGFEHGYEGGNDDGYIWGYDVGYSEGYTEGAKSVGNYLDIPKIISSVASFVPTFIGDSLDFDLFGINVAGLVMLALAASLAIFIVVLIGRFK